MGTGGLALSLALCYNIRMNTTEEKSEEARRLSSILRQLRKEGVEGLAIAILVTAIRDWRVPSHTAWLFIGANRHLFSSVRDEIRQFWYSDWGIYLRTQYGLEDVRIEDIAPHPDNQKRLDLHLKEHRPRINRYGARRL